MAIESILRKESIAEFIGIPSRTKLTWTQKKDELSVDTVWFGGEKKMVTEAQSAQRMRKAE